MAEHIVSRQNQTVKLLRALSKSKELREEMGVFVCEGEKLLYEAISEKLTITVILANEKIISQIPTSACDKIFSAPQDILESITTLKNAQNVIFACKFPKCEVGSIKKAIILDSLQDTGNIGTIIRTADALGIDAVFCDGCADIYNPKTIRSAMGSVFRVPIVSENLKTLIPRLQGEGVRVYASELYGEPREIGELDLKGAAVVIGNEGNGVRPEVSALCDGSVIIPMRGGAESLNAAVAASIFMYKMSEG